MFTRASTQRFLVGLFVAGTAAAVFAASPHFKRKPPVDCTVALDGSSVTCTGAIAGLGNEDLEIQLAGSASFDTFCVTPSGSNESPGQNPATAQFSASEPVDADEIKNGTLLFSITAPIEEPNPTATEVGCPGSNWNVRVGDGEVTSASLQVFQPVGTLILSQTFTSF